MLTTSTSAFALTRAWSPQPFAHPPSLGEHDCHCPAHDVFTPSALCQFPPPKQPFNLLDNLTRVPTKCYYCDGSGKCQQDYPRAGSGKGPDGEKEYYCSGSGKCGHCGGSGWIYARFVIAA